MKLSLVLLVTIILGFCTSCASTSSGHAIVPIENMSDRAFNNVVLYTGTAIRTALNIAFDKGLLDANGRERAILGEVAAVMRNTASGTVSETVSDLLTSTLEQIPSFQSFEYKDIVYAAVEFIEDYIEDRGGFSSIKLSDGTFALSVRTKRLLLAVAGGIEQSLMLND